MNRSSSVLAAVKQVDRGVRNAMMVGEEWIGDKEDGEEEEEGGWLKQH